MSLLSRRCVGYFDERNCATEQRKSDETCGTYSALHSFHSGVARAPIVVNQGCGVI